MFRLVKLGILGAIIAAVVIGVLWVTGVIPNAQVGEVVLKTFAALAILFVAAFAWRGVRGRTNVPDKTDQPVP